MKKIIINFIMSGLLSYSIQSHAMAGNPSSQHAWINPVLASATCIGGLCTAGFFWNKNRNLVKPKKPGKVTIDCSGAQIATKNIQCLEQIQEAGKKLKPRTDDHIELKKQFEILNFEQEADKNNKRNRAQIYHTLHLYPTHYFLSTAFAVKKDEREKIKTRSNEILAGDEGTRNAIFIANTVDEMLEHQKKIQQEREKEFKEQYDQAQERRLEYIQKNNQYKSQLAKNHKCIKWGIGIAGASAAMLVYLNKKQ